MRSYAGLIIFENIFDSIPSDLVDMVTLGNTIFNSNLLIVEDNCGTTLGKFEDLNFESQGLLELATETRLNEDRIETLLGKGNYTVATRNTSSCISKGGICSRCFSATFPALPIPKPLDRVNVPIEYLVNAEIVNTIVDQVEYVLQTVATTFTNTHIYMNGVYLVKNTDYTYSSVNNQITLVNAPTEVLKMSVRCVKVDTTPYLGWLARTYSGSLLGVSAVTSQPLMVRSLLLSETLSENRLQSIREQLSNVPSIPTEYLDYSDSIKNLLEKALFLLALYCIYANVLS